MLVAMVDVHVQGRTRVGHAFAKVLRRVDDVVDLFESDSGIDSIGVYRVCSATQ